MSKTNKRNANTSHDCPLCGAKDVGKLPAHLPDCEAKP